MLFDSIIVDCLTPQNILQKQTFDFDKILKHFASSNGDKFMQSLSFQLITFNFQKDINKC